MTHSFGAGDQCFFAFVEMIDFLFVSSNIKTSFALSNISCQINVHINE